MLTGKEYLMQVRTLDMLINSRQLELERLKNDAVSISSPKLSNKVQSGGENSAMKIIDFQEKINAEIDELVDLKVEMREKINTVYNRRFISILTDKYINGLTLEQIAENNGKDYSTICRWHSEALRIFRKENNMP